MHVLITFYINTNNSFFHYMYIIPGKKSASRQLFAVVMGLKTMQSGEKFALSLISKDNFLVAVVFEILMVYYDVYTYDIFRNEKKHSSKSIYLSEIVLSRN